MQRKKQDSLRESQYLQVKNKPASWEKHYHFWHWNLTETSPIGSFDGNAVTQWIMPQQNSMANSNTLLQGYFLSFTSHGHDKTKFRTKNCVLMLFPQTSPCLTLPFPCDQIPMPQGLRRSNGQIARSHLRSGPPQLHLTLENFRPLTLMVHSSDGLLTQWCVSWNTVQRVNS